MIQQEITHITVVPDSKMATEYQRGDIGRAWMPMDDRWVLCCPGCGCWVFPWRTIVEHKDGTVSSVEPLHCHGRNALQRYSIDHNRVRWI